MKGQSYTMPGFLNPVLFLYAMKKSEIIEKLAAGLKLKGYELILDLERDQIVLNSKNYDDVKFLIRAEQIFKLYAYNHSIPIKSSITGYYYYTGEDGHDYEDKYHNMFEYFEINKYTKFEEEYEFLNKTIQKINEKL